jgi:diacylglycerol kinase (ATP)
MTWWVIVNPSAGSREQTVSRVQGALDRLGIGADLQVSESAADIRRLVDAGVALGASRFAAAGGDGTVSLVADAILSHAWERPPTLAILPTGSGCDFIRTFGISQVLEEAAGLLLGESTVALDVGVAEGAWGVRRFVNVLDVGVIAATVRTAERATRRLGRLRYKAAFWITLPLFRTTRLMLTGDRQSFQGRANTLVLANGRYFGFNMNVAPDACPNDGLLEVQVFTGPKTSALRLLPKVTRGQHLSHRLVTRFQSSSIAVETERPWPIEVDGDYLGETPLRVRIESGTLLLKI